MTDYNLLAKAEIEKWQELVPECGFYNRESKWVNGSRKHSENVKVIAVQAIQGIIDALNNFDPTIMTLRVRQQRYDIITHYTKLKECVLNYKI